MTFEQALAATPEWILLRAKKDFIKDGDEVFRVMGEWHPVEQGWIGEHCLSSHIYRRSIPLPVREAMAREMQKMVVWQSVQYDKNNPGVWPFESWLLSQ